MTSGTHPRLVCVGIDVQVRRRCSIVVLDADLRMIHSGWLGGTTASERCEDAANRLREIGAGTGAVAIGIDAPRRPLDRKRTFYWDRKTARWRKRRPSERGWGRHCEVVIRSSGIANPQWTPLEAESPEWMMVGYGLFRGLEERGYETHEVFPSASYSLLADESHRQVAIDFSAFLEGPKDMLDACVAAYTVHEYRAGRGTAVGDDGLGQIVLPRPLPKPAPAELLAWPSG